jgi:hypothetical protein
LIIGDTNIGGVAFPGLERVGNLGITILHGNVERLLPNLTVIEDHLLAHGLNDTSKKKNECVKFLPKLRMVLGHVTLQNYHRAIECGVEVITGELAVTTRMRSSDYRINKYPKLKTVYEGFFANEKGAIPSFDTEPIDLHVLKRAGEVSEEMLVKRDPSVLREICEEYGYLYTDGIYAKITRKRKVNDSVVYRLERLNGNEFYCVCVNGVYSHGDTYKEAKKSLIYKRSDRDVSDFKEWTLDTVVSVHDAIDCYRAVTGACELGTQMFYESLESPKEEYSIRKVIEIVNGEYGSNEFANFFNE